MGTAVPKLKAWLSQSCLREGPQCVTWKPLVQKMWWSLQRFLSTKCPKLGQRFSGNWLIKIFNYMKKRNFKSTHQAVYLPACYTWTTFSLMLYNGDPFRELPTHNMHLCTHWHFSVPNEKISVHDIENSFFFIFSTCGHLKPLKVFKLSL